MKQTFSAKVIARFLKDQDLEEFLKKYDESRTGPVGNRISLFESKMTELEEEAIDLYINRPEMTLREIGKKLELLPTKATMTIKKGLSKLVYQNRDRLKI